MARVKRGVTARARHKKTLKAAKGYYNARRKVYRVAKQAVTKAQQYAYIGRKQKKRQFRALWIVRINAAARQFGVSYSQLIDGLKRAGVVADRKVLADLAVHDIAAFGAIVDKAGAALDIKVTHPANLASAAPDVAVEVHDHARKPATRAAQSDTAARSDDLTKIEGIGPKIAGLLGDAGIHTFRELAAAKVERLCAILHDAGGAYAAHDPETWPAQAKLAAAGNFGDLKKLQDELVGGRPAPDDLTTIEGIGPKIAELLHEAGIRTFAELAGTKAAQLSTVLHDGGPHFASHDPETWPRQARLAADGKFDELKKLQDELVGGRPA